MCKQLAAGLIACTAGAVWAGAAPTLPTAGLHAFLSAVVSGEPRSPRHYAQELAPLPHRSGKGSVLPTLTVVAGKLGGNRCVYQFRLETWALNDAIAEPAASEPTGGRSTVKQAPCDSLVQEVLAVAEYEVGALAGRVVHGAPRASNVQRDAVVAAVRDAADEQPGADAPAYLALTLPSRVNLRAKPSLEAPVRATLAPSTQMELLATSRPDWYAMRDGGGYLHRKALQSLQPLTGMAAARPVVVAQIGKAYVPVRDEPSIKGRVVARLSPGTEVRLYAEAREGWSQLANDSGYIPTRALSAQPVGARVAAASMRVRLER